MLGVVDDFLDRDRAEKLAAEFLPYEDPRWLRYDNPVEEKLACNNWNAFGPEIYKFFAEMNSPGVIDTFGDGIYPDPGLHGGGMHMHGPGGNLNPHLDYEIHPKLGLRRKINLILYLSDLPAGGGGALGFWEDLGDKPGKLMQEVEIKFNRAVIFETSRCWHGMVSPMRVSDGVYRKSLAVYYLADASSKDGLKRARFVAREGQTVDAEFLRKRSSWNQDLPIS